MMNQKELKQRYADILSAEVWKDPKMVDYCVKKTAHIVELVNGDIVAIEKPSIQKNFCFGYSDSRYDTEDFDRANDMAEHARNSVDYFMSENLKGINETIDSLEGKGRHNWEWRVAIPYYGQSKDSKLRSIWCVDIWESRGKEYPLLEGEDLQRVIEGYKVVKADFEKRLNTYLKRYGLSKVNSWSYWQDA